MEIKSRTTSTDRAQEAKTKEVGSKNTKRKSMKEGQSGNVSEDQAGSVSISSQAKSAARVKEAAGKIPDVDEAKVAKFKSAIESGAYKVNADAVADRMVDEHFKTML